MTDLNTETPEQRKARQFDQLRQLGRFAMNLAERAHAQAERQLDAPRDKHTPAPQQDYAATFASMSRAVRQTIAIEIRLDAPPRTRPGFRLATCANDPRRPLLHRLFRDAVAQQPHRVVRGREIVAYIDQHLDADPDRQEPIDDTIAHLCEALGVVIDIARVPDEILDQIHPEPPTDPPPKNH